MAGATWVLAANCARKRALAFEETPACVKRSSSKGARSLNRRDRERARVLVARDRHFAEYFRRYDRGFVGREIEVRIAGDDMQRRGKRGNDERHAVEIDRAARGASCYTLDDETRIRDQCAARHAVVLVVERGERAL